MTTPYRKRINLPNMESILLGVKHTLTLNKVTKYSSELKGKINQYLNFIRRYIHPYMSYKIYPELSSSGQLHYHGTCIFHSLEHIWLFYDNLYGISNISMEIDTIKEKHIWNEYITKQSPFRFIFKERLLPYTLKHTIINSDKQ